MFLPHRSRTLWSVIATVSACHAAFAACPRDDAGLKLPAGFCATIFADGIGHARQLVVAANGVVYVNTWSGRYYANKPPHEGGFLVALTDTKQDRRASCRERV